jgi:hypothetical protein
VCAVDFARSELHFSPARSCQIFLISCFLLLHTPDLISCSVHSPCPGFHFRYHGHLFFLSGVGLLHRLLKISGFSLCRRPTSFVKNSRAILVHPLISVRGHFFLPLVLGFAVIAPISFRQLWSLSSGAGLGASRARQVCPHFAGVFRFTAKLRSLRPPPMEASFDSAAAAD